MTTSSDAFDIRAALVRSYPEQVAQFEASARDNIEKWRRFGCVSLSMRVLGSKKGDWWVSKSEADKQHGSWGTFWFDLVQHGNEHEVLVWPGLYTATPKAVDRRSAPDGAFKAAVT